MNLGEKKVKEFYKKNKKTLLTLALAAFVIFLSACGRQDVVDSSSTGFWDSIVIYNLQRLLLWMSDIFGLFILLISSMKFFFYF